MHTVHATTSTSTSLPNTGLASRRITFICHGCEEDAASGCRCLAEYSILDRFERATVGLLVKGNDPARSDHARAESRRLARARLRECLELREQLARERAAFRVFVKALLHRPPSRYSARRDIAMLRFMMEDAVYGNYCPMRSVEVAAEMFRRPVAYVRALRDRCLRAMEGHPVELPQARAASASRRAA